MTRRMLFGMIPDDYFESSSDSLSGKHRHRLTSLSTDSANLHFATDDERQAALDSLGARLSNLTPTELDALEFIVTDIANGRANGFANEVRSALGTAVGERIERSLDAAGIEDDAAVRNAIEDDILNGISDIFLDRFGCS